MNESEFHFPFENESFLSSDEALPRRPRRSPEGLHGAARLADEAALAPWLSVDANAKHVTRLAWFSPIVEDLDAPLGVRALFQRTLCIPEHERNRHLLIVGQPGTGKTTAFVLPLIYADLADPERGVIVFDAKGELAPFVRVAAKRAGRAEPVQVLNFADRTRSLGWNPLETLPTDPAELESRAYELAHALCWATEVRDQGHDSVFFLNCSINLIAGLVQGLVLDASERPCLARVREILELPREEFFAWLREHAQVPSLVTFHSYLKSASWNAETVLADAQSRLSALRDQDLASVTSKNELDLDRLIDGGGVLVVEMREADIPRLRPFWNLFCSHLLDHLTRRASREPRAQLPRPVSIHLDEFASSIGRIPNFEISVNTLRGPRVAITAATQSLGQVAHLYGAAKDAVLAGFNSKVFLAGLERVDAEYASALAGTMSAQIVTRIEEQDRRATQGFRDAARHHSSVPRPLFFPEEIARPPKHFLFGAPATFFLPGTPPFQAWVGRAYEVPGLRDVLGSVAKERPETARRALPLLWKPTRRPGVLLPRAAGKNVLEARYERLKRKLAFEHASVAARTWWLRFEEKHRKQLAGLVQLLESLVEHSSTLDDLHGAHRITCRDEPNVLASYVRYQRTLRDLDVREQLDLGWPPEPKDERRPSAESERDAGPRSDREPDARCDREPDARGEREPDARGDRESEPPHDGANGSRQG